MNCERMEELLNDYRDQALPETEQREVGLHLQNCSRCHWQLQGLESLLQKAAELPRDIAPPRDLWPMISAGLNRPASLKVVSPSLGPSTGWFAFWKLAAAMVLLSVTSLWIISSSPERALEVTRVPAVLEREGRAFSERLSVGEWLETDGRSRARITMAGIGYVEVEPNTRIRLTAAAATEHRLALARGRLHAAIWAPPRLFFVDTPSATAIDLGCVYTLEVDDQGGGLLRVTAGWVALDLKGRESIVPAGAVCLTRPGIGPGTPYFEDASPALRSALFDFDFRIPSRHHLATILSESRARDGLTLWHLLPRVESADRAAVYERLAALAPPPPDVTRTGILSLDGDMLTRWRDELF